MTLQTVEIEPKGNAGHSVIWLHGLGADGHDFEPIAEALQLPKSMNVRFVFPHAPMRPVTINGGYVMRAWYDILDLDRNGRQDETGIRDSERLVGNLIQREVERGVPEDRIVLAGFSQGGAITLQAGLRYPKKLAGLIVLSSYLPLEAKLEQERAEANQQTPIFMAHGSADPVLPFTFGQIAYQKLCQLNYQVDWHAYPMAHEVHPREVLDIRDWFLKVLPA